MIFYVVTALLKSKFGKVGGGSSLCGEATNRADCDRLRKLSNNNAPKHSVKCHLHVLSSKRISVVFSGLKSTLFLAAN